MECPPLVRITRDPCSRVESAFNSVWIDCAQFCGIVESGGISSEVLGSDRRIKVFLNEEAHTRGAEISSLEDDVAGQFPLKAERPAHVIRIDQVAGDQALRIIRRDRARYSGD